MKYDNIRAAWIAVEVARSVVTSIRKAVIYTDAGKIESDITIFVKGDNPVGEWDAVTHTLTLI